MTHKLATKQMALLFEFCKCGLCCCLLSDQVLQFLVEHDNLVLQRPYARQLLFAFPPETNYASAILLDEWPDDDELDGCNFGLHLTDFSREPVTFLESIARRVLQPVRERLAFVLELRKVDERAEDLDCAVRVR